MSIPAVVAPSTVGALALSPQSAGAPIGVFDSGLGGLSVLATMRRRLPHEAMWYVADSAHAPYGEKSEDYITHRVLQVGRFLLQSGVKALVVACNTATVVAVDRLRAMAPVPVVAMEPAIKPAMAATRSGVVAVLATRRTLASASVARLCALHAQGKQVLLQACPGWVEQVEAGQLSGPATLALVREALEPVLAQGADVLVLGCTHYPLLRVLIEQVAGPSVQVVESSEAVTRELIRRLPVRPQVAGVEAVEPRSWGECRCMTTHTDVPGVQSAAMGMWPADLEPLPLFEHLSV